MSYSREFLIQQFKKGVKDYLPIASAAETMINYKLSQLDEDDWARIEEFFNSFKFPLHVYRGLNVRSEKDVDFKNPGNNWTVDTALFHAPLSAFKNSNYILEGYIDEDQIDWPETVQNFMYYSINAARNQRYPENEVTLKKGQVPHDLTGAMKESLTEDVYSIDDSKEKTFQNQIDGLKGNVKITLYTAKNGHNYAEEYLKNLYRHNKKLCAKLLANIQVFKQLGNRTPEKYSKYLKDGIFELRASVATNEARELYFFAIGGNEIVITNGFTKKTQQAPSKEIDKAIRLRDEYYQGGQN